MGVLRRLYIAAMSLLLGVAALLVYFYSSRERVIVDDKQYLLTEFSSAPLAEVVDGRLVKCDRGALSNIVLNLVSSGFSLNILEQSDRVLDLSLSNGEDIFRIYWNGSGTVDVFSKPYEKDKEIVAYINESKSN